MVKELSEQIAVVLAVGMAKVFSGVGMVLVCWDCRLELERRSGVLVLVNYDVLAVSAGIPAEASSHGVMVLWGNCGQLVHNCCDELEQTYCFGEAALVCCV